MHEERYPNLIIAGVNRAGTTSLFVYLSQHPELCVSKIKETNYFIPVIYNNELLSKEKYLSYFKHCNGVCKYILEASPRYFFGGEKIACKIKEMLGDIRILLILRNPSQRLLSYYNQRKRIGEIEANFTFSDYANKAINDFLKIKTKNEHKNINIYSENVYVRGLVQGFYYKFLSQWYNVFGEKLKVLFFDDLMLEPIKFMNTLCEWLEIKSDIYQNYQFPIENKTVNYKNLIMHNIARSVADKLERVMGRDSLIKKKLKSVHNLLNVSKEQKNTPPISAFEALDSFYAPYNEDLFHFIHSIGYVELPVWLQKFRVRG